MVLQGGSADSSLSDCTGKQRLIACSRELIAAGKGPRTEGREGGDRGVRTARYRARIGEGRTKEGGTRGRIRGGKIRPDTGTASGSCAAMTTTFRSMTVGAAGLWTGVIGSERSFPLHTVPALRLLLHPQPAITWFDREIEKVFARATRAVGSLCSTSPPL